MTNWLRTKATYIHTRATTRNDRGQTAVEYLGIIAVVVAIVLVISGTGLGTTIYQAIVDKIDEVTGG
ncbi:hypothetical protein ACWF8U_07345 [Streptomyces olivaceus]|jgi:pilus assembly protein Flp/PilA|uniref:hypothetical protein n=1 Tax=Streptomyces TaxID=1883 RepID=UPI001413A94E|nr:MULTISPECIES: hypothetical protein [Streptomyces]MBZ6207945.1 hypothetical protein [Streptomyces olivaceus]MBZ6303575.1 hypothetical protein [Streptomyces olivaceus]MBZ6317566.1 hypothetical protein [Streptomyces olivaceus]MCC2265224.1 hypothetical protein [Streptomyces sp. CT1-17]QIP72394.1 hypothetical protein EZV63_23255 [Streptomyces sp. VN1]